MLCSSKELGLNDDTAGLFELPANLTTGEDLVKALALDDTLLEVNLTPNRGDCMSVAGIAREVAAVTGAKLNPPIIDPVAATIGDTFPVKLSASAACPKLVSRVLRGVNAAAQSPFWLQERLRRAGVRPISVAVDVTNYVLLELGQPMHAYDLGKLNGGLNARLADAGEPITLLDGRTIELTDDVLVIADTNQPVGFAGVMGGLASSITDATTDVLLEAAFFTPDAVAGRGRRYGLVTDASQRFERGVDPTLQERAIERATQLLIECAGGKAGPRRSPAKRPLWRRRSVCDIAASNMCWAYRSTPGKSKRCCRVWTCSLIRSGSQDAVEWQVTPPSWRFDIHIEEDLIEEVARLFGFDNIPEQHAQPEEQMAPCTETRVRNERAADLLVDRGYHEAITYSFTDAALQSILFPEAALALKNPISAELGVMRLSLWPGLIQAVRENQRRQQQRVRLFEIGRRFAGPSGAEDEVIAGVVSGSLLPQQWEEEPRAADFFDVKGDVEAMLRLSGDLDEFRFVAQTHPSLHPGQSARIYRGERPVGWLGALHPSHQKALDLTYRVVMFELETAVGLAAVLPAYREVSKYPAIRRDIAVIVDESVSVAALHSAARDSAGELLKEIAVLSVYRGKQFDKGKKSIALGLHLQDTSRTLTDAEADLTIARVVDHLARQFDATIRDK